LARFDALIWPPAGTQTDYPVLGLGVQKGGGLDRRKTKVEPFEQMRREYEHGAGTIIGVARKFGVHRRMVREVINSAVRKPRKTAERDKPKMAAVIPWIEGQSGRRRMRTSHDVGSLARNLECQDGDLPPAAYCPSFGQTPDPVC
jgi:hypothetical protein